MTTRLEVCVCDKQLSGEKDRDKEVTRGLCLCVFERREDRAVHSRKMEIQ